VLKAKRATASLIANKVDDETAGKRQDQGIIANAEEMEKKLEVMKNDNTSSANKKTAYQLGNLLPEDMISLIPYKQTYEALTLMSDEST